MSKASRKSSGKTAIRRGEAALPCQAEFDEVLALIDAAKARAFAAVNTALIELYWSIGQHISRKIAEEGWGQGTVEVLSETIRRRYPTMRGFSAQNLWRMRQFYETYRDQPKLSALLRELSWTHNLFIMGKCKRDEEREFYLRLAQSQQWPSRELERQINGALFERVVLSPTKLSAPLRELHPDAVSIFKDTYLVEFLDLPSSHSEADLQRALIEQLKRFLLELGRDFCFIGAEYPVQVGGRDFALDRDVKKPHEQPTIGVLLCATKNNEVVEYALSRSMSPALVAEYQTRLPDRKLLQAKLHEFYALAQPQAKADAARAEDLPQPAAKTPAAPNKRKVRKTS
jgi:predicted nuclease of restriction endonuclease-like (RecB) superfamily